MSFSDPVLRLHGSLVHVSGLGVLITGESGLGKSGCCLELISRGHQLVADDVVYVRRAGERLTGSAPETMAGLIEVRGLGICNVRELYGESSVSMLAELDLCIHLCERDAERPPGDGADPARLELLDVAIPKFIVPAGRDRNLSIVVETAVRLVLASRDVSPVLGGSAAA